MVRPVVVVLSAVLLVPITPTSIAAEEATVGADVVRQLASPDWRQRRQAVAELVARGSGAEPALRELIRHTRDAEIVRGLNLAVEQIRLNARLGPSLVTLHEKDVKPREFLDELSRQCSAPVVTLPEKLLDEPNWPALSLDVDRKPFWDVMRQVSSRLGVQYLSTETQTVRLTRGVGRKSPAVSTHGAFLVAIDLYPSFSRLNVELTVFGEPKVTLLRTAGLRLEDARDDHGHPLVPQVGRRGMGGIGFGRRGRTGSRRIFLPFQHPLDDATRIARFAGRITVTVEMSSDKWEIKDPLSMTATTRFIDSIPVTLESMTRNATSETYQLRASIPYGWTDRAGQDEITELMRTRLQVLDVHGQPLSIGGIDTYRTADGMELSAEVSRPAEAAGATGGPPVKVVWTVPDETLALTVPFEFKDLSFDDAFQ